MASEYFKKWFIELDFNQKIKKHDSVNISSMHSNEGRRTISIGLANAAAEIGKNVLLVSIDGTHYNARKIKYIDINSLNQNWQLPEVFDELLKNWKQEYDLVIIQNIAMKTSSNSMLALRSSDMNLFVLDSRYSKLNFVNEIDEMIEKMNLQNLYYLVNRAGYSPSILTKVKNIFKFTKNLKR